MLAVQVLEVTNCRKPCVGSAQPAGTPAEQKFLNKFPTILLPIGHRTGVR
jgi:hypothetical protein